MVSKKITAEEGYKFCIIMGLASKDVVSGRRDHMLHYHPSIEDYFRKT
jgi:hypothetical protein